MNLLSVENLRIHFPVRSGILQRVTSHIKAVDGITFTIPASGCVGLVGESGSGKSSTGKALIGLNPVTSGTITYRGEELQNLSRRARRPFRKKIQMVFQDPFGSLNPRMRVGEIISEPMEIHFPELRRADRIDQTVTLLEKVGLDPDTIHRYPHAFSGGQRQRIGIARALAVRPECLILDEPVSALDVSVQAQIINLLSDLKAEFNLTYLFISHDLALVEHFCETTLVMSEGKIVEQGPTESVLHAPQHPYTQKLLDAVPTL
ncbi:MAG: ABC transporter ATP-binding protein [Candidatus Methylacidiphilales bacterium]